MRKLLKGVAAGAILGMYWWIILAGMILYDMACANACW